MNSLSEFLSSPLLDFIPSNLPSNNIEQPDEIDTTIRNTIRSYSIEELPTTSVMMNTSKTRPLPLPRLPISRAIAHAPEIPLTTPLRWALFAAATETDLKCNLRIYWRLLTSCIPWRWLRWCPCCWDNDSLFRFLHVLRASKYNNPDVLLN